MENYIKPTLQTIREDLGYDDFEEAEDDALLFQQGFDMYVEEVEDGDTFIIPEGCIGQISGDGPSFMLVEDLCGEWKEEEIRDDLEPGTYRLEGDIIRYLDEE